MALMIAALVVQQFLPTFTGIHASRILLLQLVFLCAAVTVSQPTMLLLAFIGGILWDAQCALGPEVGDAEVYVEQVESLRFGFSILLFGALGFLMQGIQPLYRTGKWQFSAVLSGIAIFFYLAAEYLVITFLRGGFVLTRATFMQMVYTSVLTMLVSPLILWLLSRMARHFGHSLYPQRQSKQRLGWI
jgi:cell shape-determining protein MreD